MSFYYLNNNKNKSYTLEDLAFEKILKETPVKVGESKEWVLAKDVADLKDLILLPRQTYGEVRPMLPPVKIFDGERLAHYFLIFLFVLCFPVIRPSREIFVSDFFIDWKLYGCLLLSVYVFLDFLYVKNVDVYLKLVKVTENNNLNKKEFYEIQYLKTIKKFISQINNSKKWNKFKVFNKEYLRHPRRELITLNYESQAKEFLDKFTCPKIISERVVVDEVFGSKPMKLLDIIRYKYNFLYLNKYNYKRKRIDYLLLIYVLGILFFGFNFLLWVTASSLEMGSIIVAGFGMLFFVSNYIKSKQKYKLRIIQRNTKQASYCYTKYLIQIKFNKIWKDYILIERCSSNKGRYYTIVEDYEELLIFLKTSTLDTNLKRVEERLD